MILLYKKSSEPESAYKKVSEDTKFSISVLLLKAGVYYDFITQDKEGIYWSLFDQKNKPVYQDVYKKGTPAKLIVSSQFAGKTTVYLTARSGVEIKGVLIASQAEKLIRESSWTKNAGKENIKNIKDAAAYGDLLTLHMVTWGLNGETLTVEIREYMDDDKYNYVAEYDTEVINGEIDLKIIDSSVWYFKRKTGCYYVMVKLKGKKDYILDSGHRNFHANYLYMENRTTIPTPEMNIPKNKTATTVTVPDEPSKKKNPANSVFYYKGTKKWGKLQKHKKNGELDFSAKYEKITEKDIEANANGQGKNAYKMYVDMGEKVGLNMAKFHYESSITGTRRVLSDYVADKVIQNFYYGRGRKLSFKDWPQFQSDLAEYPYFQQYFKNYLEVIKYMLKEKSIQDKDGNEIIKIFNDKDFESRPNFSKVMDIPKYDFYGLMGGTQTVQIDIEIEEWMPGTYKIKTEMYIGDWYGADWDDLNETGVKEFAPSLKAFFMLQHYYGCQPFESEIYYKSIDYIDL